ncbi:MAG: DUF5602 domain-containing protein [Ferruginibacter sp.]|nr:DUF5602 domain-containing protein [Ferruginibacter sp.]
MKRLFMLTLTATTLFISCKKDKENENGGIFKGPEVQLHGGKAWTWIHLNKNGNPLRLAVVINDAALNSLPAGINDHDNHGDHDHSNMDNNRILKFHPKGAIVPFNHVGLGWNPTGHEPEPIYGKPHFDFHFYMTTPEAVAAIPPYEVDSSKFKKWPGPDYFPPTYFNPGGGVPQMGAHWLDVTSGEFNGQAFSQTFIYGSYDGKVTFYEPMITLDFLKTNSNFERAIPQPSKVQKSGWYPSKLRVVNHDELTEIILDAFVYRMQS